MAQDKATLAMTKRSIRTIKAELEFLCDSDLITQQQLSSIISQLPSEHEARAAVSTEGVADSMNHMNVQDSGYQNYNAPSASPSFQAHNTGDQRNPSPAPLRHTPSPQPIYQAPPAYPATPVQAPQALGYATAMYVYNGTDAGDLNLQPNDRISITEYMNAEWWKGRSERTGQEGIFPRSYVKFEDSKMPPPPPQLQNNYGNMPVAVAQGNGQPQGPSKFSGLGKKVGGRFGNAVVFGAGATMGADLVNSIF